MIRCANVAYKNDCFDGDETEVEVTSEANDVDDIIHDERTGKIFLINLSLDCRKWSKLNLNNVQIIFIAEK